MNVARLRELLLRMPPDDEVVLCIDCGPNEHNTPERQSHKILHAYVSDVDHGTDQLKYGKPCTVIRGNY
jgi:hypothetical protein